MSKKTISAHFPGVIRLNRYWNSDYWHWPFHRPRPPWTPARRSTLLHPLRRRAHFRPSHYPPHWSSVPRPPRPVLVGHDPGLPSRTPRQPRWCIAGWARGCKSQFRGNRRSDRCWSGSRAEAPAKDNQIQDNHRAGQTRGQVPHRLLQIHRHNRQIQIRHHSYRTRRVRRTHRSRS